MHMIMGDVHGGSATVSMVRQVLAWKAAHPETSALLWRELHGLNMALVHGFHALMPLSDKTHVWAQLGSTLSSAVEHMIAL